MLANETNIVGCLGASQLTIPQRINIAVYTSPKRKRNVAGDHGSHWPSVLKKPLQINASKQHNPPTASLLLTCAKTVASDRDLFDRSLVLLAKAADSLLGGLETLH